MKNPSHGATILPAERDRGCVFKEDFRSTARMVASGWTLTDTPTFDSRGIGLNGTSQFGAIPLQGELNSAEQTFHLEFYPTFAANDGISHHLADTQGGRTAISKEADDTLKIIAGVTTTVLSSAFGTYGSLWVQNGRNVLSGSLKSGVNTLWLNGTQIDTTATAWVAANPTILYVGRRGASYFPGALSRLYIGHHTSTLAEHTAVYENTMWDWENRCTVNLQMRTADYEIGNVRTLDSSGNGNHATLGDGSTPTTYPTQGAGRMTFDGGDYLDLGSKAQPTGAFTVAMTMSRANEILTYACAHSDGGLTDVAWLFLYMADGTFRFYVGSDADRLHSSAHLNPTIHTVVGVWDGTNAHLYIDEIRDVAATVGVPSQPAGDSQLMHLGHSTGGGADLTGTMFDFKYRDGEAWNQQQILDYHSRVMRRMGAAV